MWCHYCSQYLSHQCVMWQWRRTMLNLWREQLLPRHLGLIFLLNGLCCPLVAVACNCRCEATAWRSENNHLHTNREKKNIFHFHSEDFECVQLSLMFPTPARDASCRSKQSLWIITEVFDKSCLLLYFCILHLMQVGQKKNKTLIQQQGDVSCRTGSQLVQHHRDHRDHRHLH